ncbi:hypothetical protein [Luteococcus sp.]|uniref:hypothetical protein n=1 Tax=Luteococcus sp. TaxID=1969402 RepID=UPI003735B831
MSPIGRCAALVHSNHHPGGTAIDTVSAAAWRAHSPMPATAPATTGACGCCGGLGDLWPAREAISRNFTAYDQWTHPAQPWLCAACTWTFTDRDLRTLPHLITTPHQIRSLTTADAFHLLAAGPLGPHQAVVIPLRPGRRHLLPTARWAHVCTDTGCLPWPPADAHLLTTYAWLRRLGFSPTDIANPAPAYPTLRRHPAPERGRILATWQHLDPWRSPDSPWLPLASCITKEEAR